MDFSTSGIIAGLLFGTLGFWIFKKSREKMSVKLAVIGVVMMLWPYFAPSDWMDWAGGLALGGAAYYVWNDDE